VPAGASQQTADAPGAPTVQIPDAAIAPTPTEPGVGPAAGAAAGVAAADSPGEGTAPSAATGAHQQEHAPHKSPFAAGSAATRSALHEITEISSWMLATAVILVAFVVAWFTGILLSFRHAAGLTGRGRVLQFFEPGTLFWGVTVLLALALFELGHRFDPLPAADPGETPSSAHVRRSRLAQSLPLGLLGAGAAVCLSAFVGVLIELSNFGNGIDSAFAGLINYLAVLVLGGAAIVWSLKVIARSHN
jgi:hypothetical protein